KEWHFHTKTHDSQTQPHGGSLRANGNANEPTTPSPTRAPSVQYTAGGSRPTAQPHGGNQMDLKFPEIL
ncbi:MAG: hypothetical protein ACKO2L_19125, partial [Planctomycetaceae bacterium]